MYDARPERGNKHTCLSCEARFYDLGRSPIICPKCGTEYIEPVRPPPVARSPRRGWAAKNAAEPLPEAEAPEAEAEDEELLDDSEGEDADEAEEAEEAAD